MFAIKKNRQDIVEKMLTRDINLDVKDSLGNTVFSYAKENSLL